MSSKPTRRPAVRLGIVVATLLLGAGVAVAGTGGPLAQIQVPEVAEQVVPEVNGVDDLPEEAVTGQEHAEENATNAEEFTDAVRDTIDEFLSALGVWIGCVSDNASSRGTLQSDPETRAEGEFDPTEGCDPRPELELPTPGDFGLGEEGQGESGDGEGQPADVPSGPPDGAGPPNDIPPSPAGP